MEGPPDRAAADPEHRWDLSAVYADWDAWEAAFRELRDRLSELPDPDEAAASTEDATALLAALERRTEVRTGTDRLWWYARMRRDVALGDGTTAKRFGRADSLRADANRATAAVESAVAMLSPDEFESLVDAEPRLERYREYVGRVLDRAVHVREPTVEAVLADMEPIAQGPYRLHERLASTDVDSPTVERPDGGTVSVTGGNFGELCAHRDRGFRRRVHESYYDAWMERRELVAEAYRTSVDADVRLARARGYDSALESALDRGSVPTGVYGVLLESVSANADTFARHLRLRRRLLGVDQLRPWDWFVPAAKADVRMPYAAAREAVLDSLEPLGEGYRARAEELFEERRIDVYDGPGTLSMEYTSPAYGAPGYVNLSYGDDVGSALGLAHELGHAVHATLSAESQPPAYGGFDGFLAEVPSNVTEALLAEHLLETGDRGTRRAVLGHYLSRFRTMLVDMSVAAGFERRAHDHVEDGGSPSADWLDGAYADLLAEYYGSARLDDRIAARWMRLPLLFREEDWPFYAYQYVVGMAVGLAVAADLLAGDVAMRERYLDLLTAGSRRRPVELIESVGVDPTSSEPVDHAFETYERYLDELAG